MRKQLNSLKLYMLLVFLFLAIIFNAQAVEITIGDTKISLPSFSGFAEISSISPETFELLSDMCPKTNRLLAVFSTQDDARRILIGEPAILDRYLMVQSSRELEAMTLTKHQFGEFRKEIRKQWDSLFQESRKKWGQIVEKAEEVLSDQYDIEMRIELGDGLCPMHS